MRRIGRGSSVRAHLAGKDDGVVAVRPGQLPLTVKQTTFKVINQSNLSDKCYAAIKLLSFQDKYPTPETVQIYQTSQKRMTLDSIGSSAVLFDLPPECADIQKAFDVFVTYTGDDANHNPFTINASSTVK
jgi:hypothetical protein